MTHMSVQCSDTQKNDFVSDLRMAEAVLEQESAALRILAQGLDQTFGMALDILQKIDGRVIVSGMGKSGHVARKIAATLASTGTPAFFVHPAEASHGDLGMITPSDCILALSNSGKTRELVDMLEYAKRVTIPVIAMTQNSASTLAQSSTVTLSIPSLEEACPNGLAPTTSTTMMMALGDALAIGLLSRRGFSSTDFRRFHPGGELGRKLLRVQDLMHMGLSIPFVRLSVRMDTALQEMTEKKFGCIGVVDSKGILYGIITDGDIRRHLSQDFFSLTAEEVMTPHPQTLRPMALAVEALAKMQEKAITSILVVDDQQKLVGIMNIHDCLKAGLI